MRHETNHAKQRAEERRIREEERKRALQRPCRVERDGNTQLNYNSCDRTNVHVIAVIAVGTGTAVVAGFPIAGLAIGAFASVVTYMLKRKK